MGKFPNAGCWKLDILLCANQLDSDETWPKLYSSIVILKTRGDYCFGCIEFASFEFCQS